jgi:hypothetical protein
LAAPVAPHSQLNRMALAALSYQVNQTALAALLALHNQVNQTDKPLPAPFSSKSDRRTKFLDNLI